MVLLLGPVVSEYFKPCPRTLQESEASNRILFF